jgi:hypothetical protein
MAINRTGRAREGGSFSCLEGVLAGPMGADFRWVTVTPCLPAIALATRRVAARRR